MNRVPGCIRTWWVQEGEADLFVCSVVGTRLAIG